MCGIVGLFLKDKSLHHELGNMFSPMLVEMTSRGPDSAGVAIFRESSTDGNWKITVYCSNKSIDWQCTADAVNTELDSKLEAHPNGNHCVFLTSGDPTEAIAAINRFNVDLQVMSVGHQLEIYKETDLPTEVLEAFDVPAMSGSHAIGHTRMATESAVTTEGSHPYSTGHDMCLVHNGSLSNHNRLRDRLRRSQGMRFQTETDSEVAAGFISARLADGRNLHEALDDCIADLDGFFTIVVASAERFAVLRDPIACKPAVLAETPSYVAFGSEYRALTSLPDIDLAKVWEPEPAVTYSWFLN